MIQATYLVETSEPTKAITAICRGQSVGNPTLLTTYETKQFLEKWSARGTWERKGADLYGMHVQFPVRNFGKEGLNYLLSVLMGGHCDVDLIRGCRLMELELGSYRQRLTHPRYGLTGLRTLLQVQNRPFLGGILKPKIGLTPRQLADLVQQMADGGVDIIKEDEILADQYWCPMRQRLPLVAKVLQGYPILYLACITGDGSEVWKKARLAQRLGATGLHLNLWSSLGTYRDVRQHVPLPLHFQKSGDKVWTTGPFAIDPSVLYQLVNVAGCDLAHVGMYGGYLAESVGELRKRMTALSSTLPTFSCGLTPQLAEQITTTFGCDLALFSGGWIHSQPDGVAQAIRTLKEHSDGAVQPA